MIILMLQMRKLRQTAFTNLKSLPLTPSLFFYFPPLPHLSDSLSSNSSSLTPHSSQLSFPSSYPEHSIHLAFCLSCPVFVLSGACVLFPSRTSYSLLSPTRAFATQAPPQRPHTRLSPPFCLVLLPGSPKRPSTQGDLYRHNAGGQMVRGAG